MRAALERFIHRAFDAFNARDVDGILRGLDPDVRWGPPVGGPGGTRYRGHEGVRRWLADLADSWSDARMDVEEIQVLAPRGLILCRLTATGSTSGERIDEQVLHVIEMRDGLVAEYEGHFAPSRALLESSGWSWRD